MTSTQTMSDKGDEPTEEEVAVKVEAPTIETVKPWSETLATPRLPLLSPSQSLVYPKSAQQVPIGHGLGLLCALERAKRVQKSNSRLSAALLDVVGLYEQFALALNKGNQGLQSLFAYSNLPVAYTQEVLLAWSSVLSQVTQNVPAVATPWQQYTQSTLSDSLSGLSQSYIAARQSCQRRHKRAIQIRTKYNRIVRELEAFESGNNSDSVGNNNRSKRLAGKRNDVIKLRAKYQRLVQSENDSVQLCQRLEQMGLETLQMLEKDRWHLFTKSLTTMLTTLLTSLEDWKVVTSAVEEPAADTISALSSVPTVSLPSKQKPFSKILGKSFTGDESNSRMDVETLGLPEDLATLREEFRSKLSMRLTRISAVKTAISFIEDIIKAASKLGKGIQDAVNKEKERKDLSLSDAIRESEGPQGIKLWDVLFVTLKEEAEGVSAIAVSLRKTKTERLDNLVQFGERATKSAVELDDRLWKDLCDAARAQTKAQSRYQIHAEETAKARERVKSVDEGPSNEKSKQRGGKGGVNKHIANMFSILPDGGEQALKILAPGARVGFAQRSLEDADEKETKGRQVLNAAVEGTSKAMTQYRRHIGSLMTKFEDEESVGWKDLRDALKIVADRAQKLREKRLDFLSSTKSTFRTDNDSLCFTDDAVEWRMDVESQIRRIVEQHKNDEGSFKLSLTEGVLSMASGTDSVDMSDLGDDGDNDDVDDEDDEDMEDRSESSDLNGLSNDGSDNFDGESTNDDGPNWLRKPGLGGSSQHNNGRKKNVLASKLGRTRFKITGNIELSILVNYMWPRNADLQELPVVISSFACSFRDVNQSVPIQYGRMFLTRDDIVFVSWANKKFVASWTGVVSSELYHPLMGEMADSISVRCQRSDTEETVMILGGLSNREGRVAEIEQLRIKAAESAELSVLSNDSVDRGVKDGESTNSSSKEVVRLPPVPPDEILKNMTVVLNKPIKNISIQRFYDIVWSEGEGNDYRPLYYPFLEKACFDITVGKWDKKDVVSPWCKEKFSQIRVITFKVQRKTHLYIGPPIADARQTHYCRVEGNDKCVLAMTIEFSGIPYSDCFAVEIRWVASRDGNNDIKLECGVDVDFRKSTILRSKIKAGTIEESTPVQKNFYEFIKDEIYKVSGDEPPPTTEETTTEEVPELVVDAVGRVEKPQQDTLSDIKAMLSENYILAACGSILLLLFLKRFVFSSAARDVHIIESSDGVLEDMNALIKRMDRLEAEMKSMHDTLKELVTVMKKR